MTPSPTQTLLASVQDALARRGDGPLTLSVRSGVSGGDINEAAVVESDAGQRWFLKWNRSARPKMFEAELFEAEADGLGALRGAAERFAPHDLAVPAVVARGRAGEASWLLLDLIEPDSADRGMRGSDTPNGAAPRRDTPARDTTWPVRLGRGLAALHRGTSRTEAGDVGWERDNFIGRLPQRNDPSATWADFWRDRRIAPQVELAADADRIGGADLEDLERILERMDEVLVGADADGASLLHGDLWSGNVMEAADGRAAIYDPAVYRGHREVDLAMSELFGFPAGFMPAYREAWPVPGAYDAVRRDAYQLYYLLVHVNLFGRGYLGRTMEAARRVLTALGG